MESDRETHRAELNAEKMVAEERSNEQRVAMEESAAAAKAGCL